MGTHQGWFLVDPIDTVWFRAGHPFVAGEDSADPGLFPPTAWTFQGMVRSRLLMAALGPALETANRAVVQELVGPPDRLPEGWSLAGPFPAAPGPHDELEPWFPAPALLWRKGEEAIRVRPMPETDDLLGAAAARWHTATGGEAEPWQGWVSASNLEWALTGRGVWDRSGATSEACPDLPPFVAVEQRPGIRVDRETGTARDHMLYVATHHRFAPGSGLLGALRATSDSRVPDGALHGGVVPAGKKGRLASFQGPIELGPAWARLWRGQHLELDPAKLPPRLGAWVVLLTPALARADGEPPFPLRGASVVLRLGRRGPPLGGFDQVGGGGRPVEATWAPGSAWLLDLSAAPDRLDAARALQGLPPHLPTDEERLGFGQRLAALYDLENGRPLALPGDTHA